MCLFVLFRPLPGLTAPQTKTATIISAPSSLMVSLSCGLTLLTALDVTPPRLYIAQVQLREFASHPKTTWTTPMASVRSLDGVQQSRRITICKMRAHTSWMPRLVPLNCLLLLSFPASQCWMWTTSPSSSKTASASRSSTSPGGFHKHTEPSLSTTGKSFCFRS